MCWFRSTWRWQTCSQTIHSSCNANVFVGNSLVDMYTNCRSLEDARRMFNEMPSRDVVIWNAMILGHMKCGQENKAQELFWQMQQEGVRPTSVTFVEVLNECANLGALEDIKLAHVINSFNLVAILISLWRITWLRCIQNVGALRILGE